MRIRGKRRKKEVKKRGVGGYVFMWESCGKVGRRVGEVERGSVQNKLRVGVGVGVRYQMCRYFFTLSDACKFGNPETPYY